MVHLRVSYDSSDLTFTIGGTAFTLTPDQYLINKGEYGILQLSDSDYYAWVTGGQGYPNGLDFVLGEKFLEHFVRLSPFPCVTLLAN